MQDWSSKKQENWWQQAYALYSEVQLVQDWSSKKQENWWQQAYALYSEVQLVQDWSSKKQENWWQQAYALYSEVQLVQDWSYLKRLHQLGTQRSHTPYHLYIHTLPKNGTRWDVMDLHMITSDHSICV